MMIITAVEIAMYVAVGAELDGGTVAGLGVGAIVGEVPIDGVLLLGIGVGLATAVGVVTLGEAGDVGTTANADSPFDGQ